MAPQAPPSTEALNSEAGPSTPRVAPKTVIYCGVCTYPVEYCEFGASLSRCKGWLEEKHPDLFDKYYSDDALKSKMGTLSVDKQEKLEHDVEKMEKKAKKKEESDEKKKQSSKVTIKRIERNKRKYVTTIQGLEYFGVDLKKASKCFAQKFATGSSVTKNPQGLDDITVQGDVTDEIADILTTPSKKEATIFGEGGLAESAILKTEEKKKVVKAPEIAPQQVPGRV